MRVAAFRYTVPIEKALERGDGKLILVGLATGPEVDGDGERVDQAAIWSFAKQINENPGTIPFRDAHAKDGVLRDLGVMTKAWVTDSGHLGVEVELDPENPAAVYLHQQIQKGKQFGMSVRGKVMDWAYEFTQELGRSVRTFKNVVLEEISATTRPSWSHSLGTVIAKAIKDAEESESESAAGENVNDELQTEQETTETPAVDQSTDEQPVAAESVEAASDSEEPAAEAEAAAEEAATAEEQEPEQAASVAETEADEPEEASEPDDLSEGLRKVLVGFHENLTQMLTHAGLLQPVMTKSVSTDDEPTLEKALAERDAQITELRGQIEELSKSLDEATARIEELENSPAGDDSPGLVEKHDMTVDEMSKAMKALAEMSPSDRLRLGLRLAEQSGR